MKRIKQLKTSLHFVRSVRLSAVILGLVGIFSVGVLLIASTAGQASVTAPESPSRTDVSEADAARILGQALPVPAFLPPGLVRTGIGADPAIVDPTFARGPRHVRESFGVAGQNVALLIVNAGALGRVIDPGASAVTIGGTAMTFSTHQIMDGSVDATYYWEAHGLAFTLHVNLVKGLTQDLSDRIAASIR